MRVVNKITRSGAQIESFIIGKNPFRRTEYIVVVLKRETDNCPAPYTVEIVTTDKIGNDMKWGDSRITHWTEHHRKMIRSVKGRIRSYGHIVWESGFKSYGEANKRLKFAISFAERLIKTPSHLK